MLEFTNLIVYTDIITDWTEFEQAFGGASANNPTCGQNTYYVLGANIDADGKEKGRTGGWIATKSESVGFMDTFDGRGYTIANAIVGRGGLFGYVGTTAVIRNVPL